MRSDSRDRVLNDLNPTAAVPLLILVIIKWDDLILKQAIDGGGIQLILISLILVGAFLG